MSVRNEQIGIVGVNGWAGGTIYTHNLVRALALLPASERPKTVLFCKTNTDLFREITHLVDRTVVFSSAFDSGGTHGRIDGAARWLKTALSVALLGEAYPELASAAKKTSVKVVFPVSIPYTKRLPTAIAWIPDFQHQALPELWSAVDRRGLDHRFSRLLQDPRRHVVLSSHHARECSRRYYGASRAQIHILRFATVPERSWYNDPAPILKKYGLQSKYLIVCNQFWKHKDHLTAFRAIHRLANEESKVDLVCTGPTHDHKCPEYFGFLQEQIKELGIAERVHILGMIPRSDQVGLIRGSFAVLQPSRFEGWSTVLEDARALNKAVIASDFPVHIEQNVPESSFFRQGDEEDCAAAIRERLRMERPPVGDPLLHFEQHMEGAVRTFANSFLEIIEAALSPKP